jgi:hypothetical protein
LKLGGNNHVYIKRERQYYSAPYRFIGQSCTVIYTVRWVSIYLAGEQIAFHLRSGKLYTTNPDHLPQEKRYMLDLNPETLLARGRKISPVVETYLQEILNKPVYIEQAYKSCEGVLSFARKVDHQRLIAACERGIQIRVFTYGFINNLLTHQIDKLQDQQPLQYTLPLHDNIRGAEHYK